MKRSAPLKRKTPLRADPEKTRAWRRRTERALPRRGKKTRAWDNARRKLKVEFTAAQITRCELGLPGCFGNSHLGFAHTLKRRNIGAGSGDLLRVVLACSCCHDQVEQGSEAGMRERLDAVIEGRAW